MTHDPSDRPAGGGDPPLSAKEYRALWLDERDRRRALEGQLARLREAGRSAAADMRKALTEEASQP